MTRPGKCFSLFILLACGTSAAETPCAATPSYAVLQNLGFASAGGSVSGYRVHDLVTDPTTRRLFVRVEECGHPERPFQLLAFAEGRFSQRQASLPPTPGRAKQEGASVAAGTVVQVSWADSRVSLTMSGKLAQVAAVGSEVEVELAALPETGQPVELKRRVHGRLVAEGHVEVRP